MYFLFPIFMYQGTNVAFKNALFLNFVQSAKISNFLKLLTRSDPEWDRPRVGSPPKMSVLIRQRLREFNSSQYY